ncbi:MAG: hypothetical protein ABJM58_03820 [Alteripontixanthobacter sp.]
MIKLFGLLAPVALLLPQPADDAAHTAPAGLSVPEGEIEDVAIENWLEALGFERIDPAPISRQVRIEGRVVIRIVPRGRQVRRDLMSSFNDTDSATSIEERKIGKCIPMRSIAGVQAEEGNRLLFFMRDQRLVSARLEKACRSEAFYSGFYIEPSADGQLCVDRDVLRSRSGVNCEVDRLRQLVRVRN